MRKQSPEVKRDEIGAYGQILVCDLPGDLGAVGRPSSRGPQPGATAGGFGQLGESTDTEDLPLKAAARTHFLQKAR